MGNSFVRVVQPFKTLFRMKTLDRIENYSVNANDDARHPFAFRGFRIEDAHHVFGSVTFLREACFLRSFSPDGKDIVCDINMCISNQEMVQVLLASDDQHIIVAAIGSTFLQRAFATLILIFSHDFSRNSQRLCLSDLI
jgi:hypothetical protein